MSNDFFEQIRIIDKNIQEYSDENLNKIKSILRDYPELSLYFYKKLLEIDNPLDWLIPLHKSDFFNTKNNPDPIEDPNQPGAYSYPHWVILDYLERCAKENQKKPKKEITDTLDEILNNIIKNKNDNYYTNWNVIRILFLLPFDKINIGHINFIGDQLILEGGFLLISHDLGVQIIPELIKNNSKQLLLQVLKKIIDFKETSLEDKVDYSPILDKYYFETLVKKYVENIAKICGIDALKMGIKKLKEFIQIEKGIIRKEGSDMIEEIFTDRHIEEYRNQIETFIRDMLKLLPPEEIEKIVNDFIKKDHPIYKKMAMYALNHHYIHLKQVFWSLPFNPLLEYNLKPDIYKLLKDNNSRFTIKEIRQFLNWLKGFEEEIKIKSGNDLKRVAFRKKEWLTAFTNNKNQQLKEELINVNKIVPQEVDHPGHDYWAKMGAGWKEPKSISSDELLSKPREELINFLKDNKDERTGSSLRRAVTEKSDIFNTSMNDFLKLPVVFISSIFWGFYEACRQRKDLDWNKVLDFILVFIKNDSKKPKKERTGSVDYVKSFYSAAVHLLEEGMRDDGYDFDPDLLPKAEKILLHIVNNTDTGSSISGKEDIVSKVINSDLGNVLSALIIYSLRYSRVKSKEQKVKDLWPKNVKNYFNTTIRMGNELPWEFYTIFGRYLPNLHYLDEAWVKDNLDKIFPKNNEKLWIYAMAGYLSFVNKIYSVIYDLLKKKGHYQKALEIGIKGRDLEKRLVEHICVAYVHEMENFEDKESVINKLIKQAKPDHLRALIFFFSRTEKHDIVIVKEKIKPLWRKIFPILKNNKDNAEYKEIIADITEWVSVFSITIDDEVCQWLEFSIKYFENYISGRKFLEFLCSYIDQYPQTTAKLYLTMVEVEVFPRIEENKIIELVGKIYKNKLKESADQICITYAKNGYYFLRDLYDKYNKQVKDET